MGARIVAALVTMAMLFHCGAAAYRVPNWALPLDNSWAKKTAFKNYTIYFEYDKTKYNVVNVLNPRDYTICNTSVPNPRDRTGADEFKLVEGSNLFICTILNYCSLGMRLNITATAA